MEWYSATRRNRIPTPVPIGMKRKNIMRSERSQAQRIICYRIPFIGHVQKKQMHTDKKQNSGCPEVDGENRE